MAVIGLVLAVGCTKTPTDAPKTETTTEARKVSPSREGGAAPKAADDWCEEHAVPESLCTRCNPSLVAAFKSTGDWCEEHGLPESQCLKCNPNLKIARPTKEQR